MIKIQILAPHLTINQKPMSPTTQKALFLLEKCGDFAVKETEIYKPGPGELLIKVRATSLNPVDWKIQKYGFAIEDYPAILGTDTAGEVVELGEGVTGFKKGERIFSHVIFENKYASFQQYGLTWASAAARVPDNWTYDQVAGLPLALTTAYVGLYNTVPHGLGYTPPNSPANRGKYAGTPLIVLGGTSSVGQMVLQLAKISGFSPIITTASLKHTDFLKSLGATHVLDRNLPNETILSEVRKLTNGQKITKLYDSVSTASTQQLGLDILASDSDGQLLATLPAAVEVPKDKSIFTVWAGPRVEANIKLVEELYHDLITGFLEEGLIKARFYDFDLLLPQIDFLYSLTISRFCLRD
ncbi:hypothetical protein D9613_007417 [Agrocybe pediades]|uniref:Enoyl reductase (ER) domain-containing protein n=1 Tax=Agrocybe pediades TaxID=84607 RepID=A0A8H4VLK6_9AGAR|nr:hypothetical protein D9613_007417 [Agrocybe pediades]